MWPCTVTIILVYKKEMVVNFRNSRFWIQSPPACAQKSTPPLQTEFRPSTGIPHSSFPKRLTLAKWILGQTQHSSWDSIFTWRQKWVEANVSQSFAFLAPASLPTDLIWSKSDLLELGLWNSLAPGLQPSPFISEAGLVASLSLNGFSSCLIELLDSPH